MGALLFPYIDIVGSHEFVSTFAMLDLSRHGGHYNANFNTTILLLPVGKTQPSV